MSMYHDVLDVSLVDEELLSEVELLAEVLVGAQAFARRLTGDEIDRLLGVSAPVGSASESPMPRPRQPSLVTPHGTLRLQRGAATEQVGRAALRAGERERPVGPRALRAVDPA